MITASEWAAYNAAVSRISDGAASSVEGLVLGWCRAHPDATVAEAREAAKLIMEGQVQGYDELASAFAAEWYDRQADAAGLGLQNAVTCAVYSPAKSDDVARYQVRKLMNEGAGAFAKACGEYARNDALRALNETIIANVGRDRKKGVRFARVPTGRETCTFCIMLASRGAVYHTRKTAGELRHFHRRCDCKVVPGFEDDPDAELVEGYRPLELYDLWLRFKEIDGSRGLNQSEKAAAKRLLADGVSQDSADAIARVTSEPIAASPVFLNKSSELYRRMKRVKSLEGYYDVMGHSDGVSLIYGDLNDIEEELGTAFSIEELKSAIASDPSYTGGPIRVVACAAGGSPDCLAQRLADAMGVEVLAPTTTVFADYDGKLTLATSNTEYEDVLGGKIKEPGRWVTFSPRRQ